MLCKTDQILLWSNTIFKYASVSLCSQEFINIKHFENKIFKSTRSGKIYAEEAPRIEVFVDTNIQEKYNFIPNTSPLDYDDMLLPIMKQYAG